MNYTFQFTEVWKELPYLLGGAAVTLQIAFITFWCGAFIGIFGALAKVYGGPISKRVTSYYVTFFTNTPALVQIFLLYYALPDAGILLSSMTAVLIGLTLNAGAYLTEILRAGVISVRVSEMEAASALGMSRLQLLRYVILPHIAKTIYAPLSNFFIWLVLGSSLAALFGVEELTGRAINVSTASLRSIETFTVVAMIYIALTVLASGSLALVGRLAFRVKAKDFLMFEQITEQLPLFFNYHNLVFLLQAAGRTLAMTVIGCTVGFVCGFLIAVLRRSSSNWLLPLRFAGIAYVEFFRRIPFLVILFIVLFVIEPLLPGASLMVIATVSVCLLSTAFLSEVIRSGLESVPEQQIDGARALNFSAVQTLFMVVLPQSWRVILPPAAAFLVMFIKDTSLASQLGVIELTFAGKMLVNRGFSPVLGFGAILVCYFALSYPLSRLAAYLEKRLASS